jgi:hypothetical protein
MLKETELFTLLDVVVEIIQMILRSRINQLRWLVVFIVCRTCSWARQLLKYAVKQEKLCRI